MWKVLQKMYDEKQQREYMEEMQHVARAKNWDHVANLFERLTVATNPVNYRLF